MYIYKYVYICIYKHINIYIPTGHKALKIGF